MLFDSRISARRKNIESGLVFNVASHQQQPSGTNLTVGALCTGPMPAGL
jgi:hypothetical protein